MPQQDITKKEEKTFSHTISTGKGYMYLPKDWSYDGKRGENKFIEINHDTR